MIIAVHDVTAFGNTEFGKYTKFGKIPIFVYIYQILIISDPDDVTVFIIFNGFSIMETTYDLTYRTIIHTIITS